MALQSAAEERGEHPLYALERGELTEAEFAAAVESHLPGDIHLRGFSEVYFSHLHANEPMIELMRDLRDQGFRMAMLTNNVREWEALWRAKLPVDEIFEVVVDSAFVGMRKPEPAIYRLTCERLGVEASECLFIDDLEVNCDAARAAGMTPVHFRDDEQAIRDIGAALGAARDEPGR
jgi:epoxide hydrolase-like predicted phosphatase